MQKFTLKYECVLDVRIFKRRYGKFYRFPDKILGNAFRKRKLKFSKCFSFSFSNACLAMQFEDFRKMLYECNK